MVDRKGVIYKGRKDLNQWKLNHAINTKDRTLEDAIDKADVFLVIGKRSLTKKMVRKMAKNPIIFACANPDPEITPKKLKK